MIGKIVSLTTKVTLVLLVGVILAGGYGVVQADSQDIIASVLTDKSAYGWGENVMITVSVTNNGSSTLSFTFATSHQAGYSIYALRRRTFKLVSTTLNDYYFQIVTYLTLEPNETKNYTFLWPHVSETDVKIRPGTYSVFGYFVGTWTWSARSASFGIRGRGYRER